MGNVDKKSLPVLVYDDFGNPVAGPFAGRTFERQQGCWNCTAFEAGELYVKRAKECRERDVVALLRGGPDRPPRPLADAKRVAEVTYKVIITKRGWFGLCMKGQVRGDFVACKHLCDKWSGRQGVKGSRTPGAPADPLVEELYEKLGEDDQN